MKDINQVTVTKKFVILVRVLTQVWKEMND